MQYPVGGSCCHQFGAFNFLCAFIFYKQNILIFYIVFSVFESNLRIATQCIMLTKILQLLSTAEYMLHDSCLMIQLDKDYIIHDYIEIIDF